ncbi:MAG: hypothetical protein INR73_08335 [Williamsia sp.]|nr:hypothetical protein [Williamsia sp.]
MRHNPYKICIAIHFVIFALACSQSARQPDSSASRDTSTAAVQPDTATRNAQTGNLPPGNREEATQTGTGLAAFVLPNYSVLDTATGDLNGDSLPDKLLLLKKKGEDTSSDVTEHPEKRPLMILTGQADGTYKLAARNDNAVLCVDCGGVMGDPYMRLVIKGGYFSVEMAGGSSWRWTRTVTFRYAPSEHNWLLYKDGHGSFHASEPDKVETRLYTAKDFGQVSFEKFDVYKEQ